MKKQRQCGRDSGFGDRLQSVFQRQKSHESHAEKHAKASRETRDQKSIYAKLTASKVKHALKVPGSRFRVNPQDVFMTLTLVASGPGRVEVSQLFLYVL